MKTILLAIILFCSFYAYPQSKEQIAQHEKLESIKKEIQNLEVDINRGEQQLFLQMCQEEQRTIPIYSIGNIADRYNQKDTACKKARENFEQADTKLKEILNTIPGFSFDMDANKRNEMYYKLHNTHPEYRAARIIRDSLLTVSNLCLLNAIINDYAQQGRILSIPFMTSADKAKIKAENPMLEEAKMELSLLKEMHKEMLQQQIKEKYGLPEQNKKSKRIKD